MPSNPRMTIFCQYLPDGAAREQKDGIVAAAASATRIAVTGMTRSFMGARLFHSRLTQPPVASGFSRKAAAVANHLSPHAAFRLKAEATLTRISCASGS